MKIADAEQLEVVPVHYDIGGLKPVVNEIGFDLHYNGIYHKHVSDYNNKQGDFAFNKAGAFLHGLYFENIREYRKNNIPSGKVAQILSIRYGSFENFLRTLEDQSNRLQGNGWLFMNTAGYINIIPNNRIVDNVALVIDLWEHAFVPTHGVDRNKYISEHLGVIDWDVVNRRIEEQQNKKTK